MWLIAWIMRLLRQSIWTSHRCASDTQDDNFVDLYVIRLEERRVLNAGPITSLDAFFLQDDGVSVEEVGVELVEPTDGQSGHLESDQPETGSGSITEAAHGSLLQEEPNPDAILNFTEVVFIDSRVDAQTPNPKTPNPKPKQK